MSIDATTPATAPDQTPTDQSGADNAVTATGADDAQPDATEPDAPVDIDKAAVDAFEAGIAKAAPADADEPKDAADVAAAAKNASAAPAATPAPAPAPAAAEATKEPDPAIAEEVSALKLKGKAAERFHEMAGTIKEFAPLRDVLTKHQLTDPAKIEQVFETAARGIEWENTVLASTATPQQFGSALNVIKALNSNDPKVMGVAFDALLQECQELGKRLGREVPGLFDPLDAHPDLKAEVDGAEISRKRALEIAAQRAEVARHAELHNHRSQQDQNQSALVQATSDINALNNELKASDPDFARKLPYLQPALNAIRESLHPSKWAGEIRKAYLAIPPLPPVAPPAPAAPPAAPRVGHMPVRPTGASAANLKARPRTDEEAFSMGVASVSNL